MSPSNLEVQTLPVSFTGTAHICVAHLGLTVMYKGHHKQNNNPLHNQVNWKQMTVACVGGRLDGAWVFQVSVQPPTPHPGSCLLANERDRKWCRLLKKLGT